MASSKALGDFDIKDKILAITGGGSGIGLSFAKQFHARGGRVLIGDLKLTPEAEAFLHATEASSRPGSVVFQACDVTRWQDLRALVSASVRELGAVPDVYCPCAGVFEPPWSNFWDDAEDEAGHYATVRINTEHPIKLARLAFRALVGAGKKGVVLLVASTAGLVGVYGTPLYNASKHAIVGLCKSLSHADGVEGIKVVCICPGLVATPLWKTPGEERARDYLHRQGEENPINTPDEIAEAMMRLVEEGKYRGGTVLMKRPAGEQVVEEGGPSKYPYDEGYVQSVLDKERGKPWDVNL